MVSRNLHQSPDGDLPLRAENFSRYLPNDEFMDYGPQLAYDDENELTYQQLCAEGLEGFESKKDSNLTEPIAESAEEQKESVIFDDVAQEMQNDLN